MATMWVKPVLELSESQKASFKTWVTEWLHTNTMKITFHKKDESVREMNCTLEEVHLPEPPALQHLASKKKSLDIITVWDLDKTAWRSIDINRIIRIERKIDDQWRYG